MCLEGWEYKISQFRTSPNVVAAITGMLKTALGGLQPCLGPIGGRPNFPLKFPFSMNITHKVNSRQRTGEMEKHQFKIKNPILLIKTNISNVVLEDQVHPQDITFPDLDICPANLLLPP